MTLHKKTTQMNIWRERLLKAKAEKEARMQKLLESGAMYNKMVSDAVGLITAKITEETKRDYDWHDEKDGIVTITINKALIITTELKLYTGCISVPMNPQTGKQYFFDSYRFKDEEEVKKFFDDVRAQLPDQIEFEEQVLGDAYGPVEAGARAYYVKVKFDLKS